MKTLILTLAILFAACGECAVGFAQDLAPIFERGAANYSVMNDPQTGVNPCVLLYDLDRYYYPGDTLFVTVAGYIPVGSDILVCASNAAPYDLNNFYHPPVPAVNGIRDDSYRGGDTGNFWTYPTKLFVPISHAPFNKVELVRLYAPPMYLSNGRTATITWVRLDSVTHFAPPKLPLRFYRGSGSLPFGSAKPFLRSGWMPATDGNHYRILH